VREVRFSGGPWEWNMDGGGKSDEIVGDGEN